MMMGPVVKHVLKVGENEGGGCGKAIFLCCELIQIYQSNHKDEKPRWGQFLDLIEKVYTYEYAIAERNGKVYQHLKHWGK